MEKKIKLVRRTLFSIIILLLTVFSVKIYANDEILPTVVEPTKEWQAYQELSDEEKEEVLEPRKYDVITKSNSVYLKTLSNPVKLNVLLSDSLSDSYDLRDVIRYNVVIRNQMQTNSCWAFAGIGVLESNLAMINYTSSGTQKIYDFSERHLFYGARRYFFNDNEENEYGYSTEEKGGNWNDVQSYLSNGFGAIDEEDMKFVNDDDKIDISEIQNKEVITTLYDTIEFSSLPDVSDVSSEEEYTRKKADLMSKMKETISTYGGIFAGIYGADLSSSSAYNTETGALYCDSASNYTMDHAVVIIGWDDNYDVKNFNSQSTPNSNGAWIAKNSWGTDEGVDGYIYISYEDALVYEYLYAIKKATDSKDYDYLYQHSKLVADTQLTFGDNFTSIVVATKFDRDINKSEVLNKVGFYTLQEVTCSVYVNASDDTLGGENFIKVVDSVTVEPGYHILEFGDVELTGETFAIALELSADTAITFMIENILSDSSVTVNEGDNYYGFDVSSTEGWTDLASLNEFFKGNLSIKAYTDDNNSAEKTEEAGVLDYIDIYTEPIKTEYSEGESFDSTGMVVNAIYTNKVFKSVTDYSVKNGSSLTAGQTSVIIEYKEGEITKTAEQPITVNATAVGEVKLVSISITKEPDKTEYFEGENFDETGMVVTAKYSDSTEQEVEGYTVKDGNNLSSNKTSVTIQYEEGGVTVTTTQDITVNQILLESIEVTTPPDKTEYFEGENFDETGMKVTAKYNNSTTSVISGYTITNGENLTVGQEFVTIQYEEGGITETTTQDITVKRILLESIAVTTPPNKTEYFEGEKFDNTGMFVTATYNNSTTSVISGYTITNGESLTVGQESVTIQYEEKSVTKETTQAITVKQILLESIEVTNSPTKTVYTEGEDFDTSGMKITATYNNGDTEVVTDYKVVDGTNLNTNQNYVTIEYTKDKVTRTVQVAITVNQKEEEGDDDTEEQTRTLVRIEITQPPNKTIYNEGDKFNSTGMVVTAIYNNGSSEVITDYKILDGSSLVATQTSVTISYTEDGITKTTTQSITVISEEVADEPVITVESIEIESLPDKLKYIKDVEELDLTGGKLKVTFSDGTTASLDMDSEYVTVSGFDKTIEGVQTITVRLQDFEKTFEVEIIVENEISSSDFTDIVIKLSKITVYVYSNSEEESHSSMRVEISNILGDDDESDYTYYYYISSTDSEEDIEEWIVIENPTITTNEDGTKTITFDIDSRDIPNYNEIVNSDELYIYIREVVTRDDESIEQVVVDSLEITEDTDITVYDNEELVGTIEDVINIEGNNKNSAGDSTTAGGILPQTGAISVIVILILLLGRGTYSFIRCRNIDK